MIFLRVLPKIFMWPHYSGAPGARGPRFIEPPEPPVPTPLSMSNHSGFYLQQEITTKVTVVVTETPKYMYVQIVYAISIPTVSFYRPDASFLPPNQQCQSTEGRAFYSFFLNSYAVFVHYNKFGKAAFSVAGHRRESLLLLLLEYSAYLKAGRSRPPMTQSFSVASSILYMFILHIPHHSSSSSPAL